MIAVAAAAVAAAIATMFCCYGSIMYTPAVNSE